MEYKLFTDKKAREDLIEISYALASYTHDNCIDNLIFLDSSARLAYLGFKYAYHQKYIKSLDNKDSKYRAPSIYFINPDGFDTNLRSLSEVISDFNNTYKLLSANKNSKIMLFDTCIHTGSNLNHVLNALNQAGFKNLFFGVSHFDYNGHLLGLSINEENLYNFPKIDFIALNYHPYYGCKPFRKDDYLCRKSDSVCSGYLKNYTFKPIATGLRKEIKNIFLDIEQSK